MIEFKIEFVNLKLNSSTSPTEWINQLENLRSKLQKFNSKISDLDFMLHFVSNILSCYDTIVYMCQMYLRQDTLTIKSLSQDLMSKFKRMNKEEDDTALAASEGGRYRKYINRSEKGVKCENFEKKGHPSDECHSLPKNANKKAAWKKQLDDKLRN